jgi:hypothetical protein
VTGGPWRSLMGGGAKREVGDDWTLSVEPCSADSLRIGMAGRWRLVVSWQRMVVAQYEYDSFAVAVEEADEWAASQGYPAVRVEVDP